MTIISFLTIYLEHLNVAYHVYSDLKNHLDNFEDEVVLVLNLKCALLKNKGLSNMVIDGCDAIVYENDGTYTVRWKNLEISLDVVGDQIYNYRLYAFDK